MKKKSILLVMIVILLVAWISIAYSDYAKVAISFDKPNFCILINGADDGGSGKYIGLGYSFTIDGYLDAEDGYQVDKYTYRILGITIKQDEASPNKTDEDVSSEIYSKQDISDAIDTITKEFDREWNGCTLTEIYYAGDEKSMDYQEWADRNDADEVIVLLSTFEVDSSGGDGSLNPNSTYDNWMWILVRNSGGKWQHVDHGY